MNEAIADQVWMMMIHTDIDKLMPEITPQKEW